MTPLTPVPALRIARTDPADDRPEDYYPLVRQIARVFVARRPGRTTAEDMAQAGMVGVLTYWFQFDPALSSRTTWAGNRAKHAMLDALRAGGGHALIRVPKYAVARGVTRLKITRIRIGRGTTARGDECDGPPDYREPDPDPTDPTDFLEAATRLAGRALTKQERGALLLYFVRNMPMREVGEHVGRTESCVSLILSRHAEACRRNAGLVPA